MRRALLLSFVSACALAAAAALLAFGPAYVTMFASVVGRDPAVLYQIPLAFALVALVAGAAVTKAIARDETVAALHLVLAAIVLGGLLSFSLRFWPAFAENRMDLGFDVRKAGPAVASGVLLAYFVLCAIATKLRPRGDLLRHVAIALSLVIAFLVVFGERKLARGRYLPSLERVAVRSPGDASSWNVGGMCFWSHERPIAWTDKRAKVYRCEGGGISFVADCRYPITYPDALGPLTDDVEREVVSAYLPGVAECAYPPPPATKPRKIGEVLRYDRARDIWFAPSEHHASGDYVMQLAPEEIVTLRDVGAPPPPIFVRVGLVALVVAAASELERLRKGRDVSPLAVAMTFALAMPLFVAALVGLVY